MGRQRYGNELHPLYSRWLSMNQRCNNPNHSQYKNWGGRDIKICSEFEHFNRYVEIVQNLPGYDLNKSLDRIDNNGNYEPSNLRWTCKSTQTANQGTNSRGFNKFTGVNWSKSHNRWIARITFKGKSLFTKSCLTEQEALEARNQYIRDNNLPHPIQKYC